MHEDEKLRFILITSAIVAALLVHRFLQTSHALAYPTGVHFFTPDEFGVARLTTPPMNRDQRQQPERIRISTATG